MIHMESKMSFRALSGQVLRFFAATAAAALITFLLAWLGANSTTAGMVFLVWWSGGQRRRNRPLGLHSVSLRDLF